MGGSLTHSVVTGLSHHSQITTNNRFDYNIRWVYVCNSDDTRLYLPFQLSAITTNDNLQSVITQWIPRWAKPTHRRVPRTVVVIDSQESVRMSEWVEVNAPTVYANLTYLFCRAYFVLICMYDRRNTYASRTIKH